MGRRRKLYLGNASIGGKTSRSLRVARAATSSYHRIQTEIHRVSKDPSLGEEERSTRLAELGREIEGMGGVEKYQQGTDGMTSKSYTERDVASILSTARFKTSRYFIQVLEQLQKKPAHGTKLKTFEVGAINLQLSSCPWLSVFAIDIHSQHPSIQEIDFFDVLPEFKYDVVVCSMVSLFYGLWLTE